MKYPSENCDLYHAYTSFQFFLLHCIFQNNRWYFSVSSRIIFSRALVNFTCLFFRTVQCWNISYKFTTIFFPLLVCILSLDDDVVEWGEKNLFLRSQIDTKAHYLDSFLWCIHSFITDIRHMCRICQASAPRLSRRLLFICLSYADYVYGI